MSRILVTGATTPLGAELVNQLLENPQVERVLGVGIEPDAGPRCERDRFDYRWCDLSHARPLRDLIAGPARELAIDTIVHTAYHRDPQATRSRALHVEGTRQLLVEAARQPTIRRFVLRSVGAVYALRSTEPSLIDEDTPLELDPRAPRYSRERVEADVTTCAHMGRAGLSIAILRCAEVLGPDVGSQLHDYLRSHVCLRPLGFDPMINVLSIEDCARALAIAATSSATGVFNIPGADTLPLSNIVRRERRRDVPVPGPSIAPLYKLRALAIDARFQYGLNHRRFHFGGVLDGRRARLELGFVPEHPIWSTLPARTWN